MPSADPEKREEAADALCRASKDVSSGQVSPDGCVVPQLYQLDPTGLMGRSGFHGIFLLFHHETPFTEVHMLDLRAMRLARRVVVDFELAASSHPSLGDGSKAVHQNGLIIYFTLW